MRKLDYAHEIAKQLARLGATQQDLPPGMEDVMGPPYLYGFLSGLPDGISREEFRRQAYIQDQAERAVRGLPIDE